MATSLDQSKALLIRRWGEMGGYWGINRTMAEIHALLFVSDQPLCTDDIMARLHVSRGNASMNLRGLVDWGLIERVHKLGDRKEYFQADTDVWRMFETILRERRRREVEPIITTIGRCREMVADVPDDDTDEPGASEYRSRLTNLQDFLLTVSTLFELTLQLGRERVSQLADFLRMAGDNATGAPGNAGGPDSGGAARGSGTSRAEAQRSRSPAPKAAAGRRTASSRKQPSRKAKR